MHREKKREREREKKKRKKKIKLCQRLDQTYTYIASSTFPHKHGLSKHMAKSKLKEIGLLHMNVSSVKILFSEKFQSN